MKRAVYCIPVKKSYDDYEFHQDVPVTDYVDAALLWTLAVSFMAVETCVALGKARLEVEEKPGLFTRRQLVKVPRDWETQRALEEAIASSMEAFWRCARSLKARLAEEGDEPSIRSLTIHTNPLLACASFAQLALYESNCDTALLHDKMSEYLRDPDEAEERVIRKIEETGLLIPCRFWNYLRERGLEIPPHIPCPRGRG